MTFIQLGTKKIVDMSEGDFNKLSLGDRAKLLWEKGSFVQAASCFNYCLVLYGLNREFVEVFYDKDSETILWIRFANELTMTKYLDKIQIQV